MSDILNGPLCHPIASHINSPCSSSRYHSRPPLELHSSFLPFPLLYVSLHLLLPGLSRLSVCRRKRAQQRAQSTGSAGLVAMGGLSLNRSRSPGAGTGQQQQQQQGGGLLLLPSGSSQLLSPIYPAGFPCTSPNPSNPTTPTSPSLQGQSLLSRRYHFFSYSSLFWHCVGWLFVS